MEEVKILHETAKLAKIKGFNIGNDSDSECYDEDGNVTRAGHLNYNQICYRPTQALLAKWLREKHSIHIEVIYVGIKKWAYSLNNMSNGINGTYNSNHDTHEDALEIGLQGALKSIKLLKDLQVSE